MKQAIESFKKYFAKYKIDLLVIAIFVAAGIIFAGRPDVEVKLDKLGNKREVEAKSSKPAKETSEQKNNYKHLDERNIFSETGSYETAKGLLQIPENPYNLIAVLRGMEKRAVFREFTGNMVSLKVGDKLIDGAVIEDIGDMSVKIKKGKETKDYRIFEVKGIAPNKETKGGKK